MKQTWRATWTETCLDVASGYVISVFVQIGLFHLYGIHVSLTDNMELVAIFTVISVVRKLVWRRIFEALRVKGILP